MSGNIVSYRSGPSVRKSLVPQPFNFHHVKFSVERQIRAVVSAGNEEIQNLVARAWQIDKKVKHYRVLLRVTKPESPKFQMRITLWEMHARDLQRIHRNIFARRNAMARKINKLRGHLRTQKSIERRAINSAAWNNYDRRGTALIARRGGAGKSGRSPIVTGKAGRSPMVTGKAAMRVRRKIIERILDWIGWWGEWIWVQWVESSHRPKWVQEILFIMGKFGVFVAKTANSLLKFVDIVSIATAFFSWLGRALGWFGRASIEEIMRIRRQVAGVYVREAVRHVRPQFI